MQVATTDDIYFIIDKINSIKDLNSFDPEDIDYFYIKEMIHKGRVLVLRDSKTNEISGFIAGENLIYNVGLIHWVWLNEKLRGTDKFKEMLNIWKNGFTYILSYTNLSAQKAFKNTGLK
jgi:hypothetical protein